MRNKMGRQSLYHLLLFRTLIFLIIPFLLVTGILFFLVAKDGERNYWQKVHMLVNQVVLTRQSHVDTVKQIETRIAANETLKGFFLVPYSSDNLFYYSSVIRNLLSPESGEEGIYSLDVYYTNETIPAGFGRFHRLDFMAPKPVTDFANDSQMFCWVIPREENGSYLYMRKVYAGERMVYILTVSVASEAMNHFLLLSGEGEAPIQRRESSGWLAVNDSRYSFEQLLGERTLEELADMPDFRVVKTRARIEGFPQEILVITDRNVQMYWIYAVFFLVILLVFVLIWNQVGFIREIFAQIQSCMKGFETSVAGGFEQKLTVHGNNEISRIEEGFNVQIDKIQELLNLSKRQVELVKDSQLMALQHQINPHFLYNTLETFSYLMERHGHYEEADAIVSFSRMMRYNTMKNSSGYATIGQELTQVQHYLNIQRLKNQELHVRTEIPKDLTDCEILRFLLQPLIENCVQHGYWGKPLEILLKCQADGDYLHFQVFDNGCGMSKERVEEINRSLSKSGDREKIGIGLSNINDRLCLFYSEECRLHVESEEGHWTRIRFSVPFRFSGGDPGGRLMGGGKEE